MKLNRNVIYLSVILLINIIILAFSVYGFPIRFEENDDIIMCLIANGEYSGTPDCHLVFINALFGSLLACLYKIFPAFEWYTISFCILHVVSMTCVVYLLIKKKNLNTTYKLIWLSFFYVIWIRMLMTLQFTTTAGISAVAGCWLMCHETRKTKIIGGILIIIASMLRFQVVGLVVLLFIPLFIYQFKLKYKQYIPLILIGTLVLIIKFSDNFFYQSPEWKYYKQYNQIRGQLNDNPNAHKLDVNFEWPNGVKRADYEMLLSFIADPTILDLEALKIISGEVKRTSLQNKIQNVSKLRLYLTITLLMISSMALLSLNASKTKKVYLVASLLLFCLVAIGISLNGTLKNRVFLCMLLSIIIGCYHVATLDNNKRFLTLCLLGVIMLMNGKYVKQIHNAHKTVERKITYWNEISTLLEKMPDDGYRITSTGADMVLEGMSIFKVKIPNYSILGLGWLTSIPFNAEIFNSYRDFTRNNIHILTPNNETSIQRVQSSIQNNYFINTSEEILAKSEHYKIIKLIPDISDNK